MASVKHLLVEKLAHHHAEAGQERDRREVGGAWLELGYGAIAALHDLGSTLCLVALSAYEREGDIPVELVGPFD